MSENMALCIGFVGIVFVLFIFLAIAYFGDT